MRLQRKSWRKNCLLRDPGCLSAAMLLLAVAVIVAGQYVWVGDFVSGPELCAQDEEWEAAGTAEGDKILMEIQLSHAAVLAFQSAPH